MWLGLSVRWGGGAERERGREGEGEVLAAQRVVAGGGGADAVLLEDEAYGHSWGLGFGIYLLGHLLGHAPHLVWGLVLQV